MEVGDEKIRILLIEDNPGDARLIRELLTAAEGVSFNLEHADRLSTGLARLARGDINVILLDLSLPDSQGLDGLNKICEQTPKVPVVVMSGLSDEAVAVSAVQEGAQDYLVKGSVDSDLLVRSLRYAIERQHLRVALSESEAGYRLLADNSADVIWTANMKWQITYVSPAIKRLLGYTVEEMMRLAIKDILTPDSLKQAGKLIRNQMDIMTPRSQYPSLSLTLEYVRKDGSTLWAEVMLSFLWDKDGKLSEVLGVTREITERKKAEEALRQSEQRYRMLAENVKDIIWTRDMNLKLTYTSPSVLEMSGYSVEEVMSMSLEESLTPASLEQLRPILARVLAAGENGQGDLPEVVVLEAELIHKDGSITPVEMKVNLLRNPDGQPIGFLGVTRDITERKKVEEALRESEEELQAIFDSAGNGIALLDLEGRVIRVNKRVLEVGGYAIEDISGKPHDLLKMFTPESIERMSSVRDMVLSGKEVTAFECEVYTKSGKKLSLEINIGPFLLKGQLFGLVAVMRDITERKQMQEALQASERQYRLLAQNVKDVIWTFDMNLRLTYVSPSIAQLTGYSVEEYITKNWEEMVTPASVELITNLLAEELALEDGGHSDLLRSRTFEVELSCKDLSTVPVEMKATFLRDSDGRPIGILGVTRDITERKKMEQELRRLSDAVRMSTDSIVLSDLEGNIIDVNEATLKIQGINSKADLIGLKSSDFIAPEEQEKALWDFSRLIEEGCVNDIQYHILTRDGRRVLVETNASVMKGNNGEPVGLVAITRDITERKRMEEALRQSEHNYRVLFEGTIDGMFVTDIETVKIVLANQTVAKMFGFDSAENTIGINPLDLVHPDDKEQVLGFFMEDASGESKQEVHEFRTITKDGREIWLSGMGTRIEYGGEPAVLSSIRDVTERKRMAEALRQSEQDYRTLFDSTVDGMAVIDAETLKILLVNQPIINKLGQDIIGMNPLDLLALEDKERALKLLREEVLEKDLRLAHEYRAAAKDGSEFWISAVSTRTNFQGRLAALVSIRNITEQKRAEEEKRRMEEQLRLAGRLAAVGELAAGVAHELNNPITAIKGFAQFLTARKDLDETIRKDLDTIYRESQRAAKITQNLLSFARKHDPEKHPISINDVIENILEMQEHLMKINNIELEVELAPDLPKTMADFHQMQQVFMNIVNNAEQAMVEAHAKGRLVVKTKKTGNIIQISFADNGPGISEENLKRIFDPFFTTKEVGKGTGLGLSICYGLVEAHGGRIYAKSKLGQGATFVVELPIISENELVAEAALLKPGSRGVKWKKQREPY